MTGKQFSERPFRFPRGAKVVVKYKIENKINTSICCFYGIKAWAPLSAEPVGFKPVFRTITKDGKMSVRKPAFSPLLFENIVSINWVDKNDEVEDMIRRKDKDRIVVCETCGSTDVQHHAWVDSNTGEYINDDCCDRDDNWCDNCESHERFCYMSEFEKKMDDWQKNAEKGSPQDYSSVWNFLTYYRKWQIYDHWNSHRGLARAFRELVKVHADRRKGNCISMETFELCSENGIELDGSTIDRIEITDDEVTFFFNEKTGDCQSLDSFKVSDLVQFYNRIYNTLSHD